MRRIQMIAAVDANGGIGYQDNLLFHLKRDMEFFREKTIGNIVVMGRKTLESFPGKKALPNRLNLVLTRQDPAFLQKQYQNEENPPVFIRSWQEGYRRIEKMQKEIFVIGGGQIYREFLPKASDIYLTRVECSCRADVYFPELRWLPEWEVRSVSQEYVEDKKRFRFWHYQNRNWLSD